MHVLGKTFVGLILVAALVAGWLTVNLAKKRDNWISQIVALKKTRDENNEKLRVARATFGEIEGKVNRQMELWGQQWEAPNSTGLADANQALVQLGVGLSAGLGAQQQATNQPLPTVYVFAESDAGSAYLGEFRIEGANNNQANGILTREPYPGEVESWPSATFRVRQFIPSAWRSTFFSLHTQQTLADQQVIDEQSKLAIQEKHIAESQAALDRRLAELNGDQAALPKASEDVKQGLVESIRQEEADRNLLLLQVDELRRAISDSYAALLKTLDDNRAMIDQMSDAAAPEGQTASGNAPGRTR